MMRIVLIGAGRLATNLGLALKDAGHEIAAVYSRTFASAESLATAVGSYATDNLSSLPREADAFIIAVKDDVLSSVIADSVKGREDQLFVHTAGSKPLSLFSGFAHNYGVFYPMQTFSKERHVSFADIPVFLEASDEISLGRLRSLAVCITRSVYVLSSEDRKYLHLSAVFACNFTNHCYALAASLLEQHGLPFSVMLPLIDETAHKVHELHPCDAQTGPAVRYDHSVIAMQRQLLADNPTIQSIYELLSCSIHEMTLNKN